MKKILLILTFSLTLFANSLTIASGGGYKKPMMEIYEEFFKSEGIKVEAIFGNMKQILMQAKMSGSVALVVGDKSFLQKSKLPFMAYKFLGLGKLVLAYPKGKNFASLNELVSDKVKKIATPHPKKAIYGKASHIAIRNAKLMGKLQDKLLIVATVPQVSSYLISKDVDAGFINLTNALAVKDKIGGFFKVEQNLYDKIEIVGGVLKPNDKNLQKFLNFLQTPKAKNILNKYGLEN